MRLKLCCCGMVSSHLSAQEITSPQLENIFPPNIWIWKHGWTFNDTTRHHFTVRWYQARLPSPKCLLIVGRHVRGGWTMVQNGDYNILDTVTHLFGGGFKDLWSGCYKTNIVKQALHVWFWDCLKLQTFFIMKTNGRRLMSNFHEN